MKPRLCYVDHTWAYFTTIEPFEKQWGDDWNDAPYEYNAGRPYDWREYMGERGISPYSLKKVAFDCDLETPDDGHANSRWSVEDINRKATPWLRSSKWSKTNGLHIWAGSTVDEFCDLIHEAGGVVYLPWERERTPA